MQDRKAEIVINDDYKIITKNEILNICECNNFMCYAFIYHDKDIKSNGEKKIPHWHIMIKLNSSRSFETFANYFNVNVQNVNKIGKWSSAVAYLTHKNAIDKYQYDDDEVIANFDFVKIGENSQKRLDLILDNINNGTYKEYNILDYISLNEYVKYKKKIGDAYEYKTFKEIKKMDKKNIEIYYFFGKTATGKTAFAKDFCNKNNLPYCVSSSSNDPLQDYKGEPVLILDELRNDSFTFAELLKITDPNNNTATFKARYRNKAFIGNIIIITSSFSPWNLYVGVGESQSQFFRRLSLIVEFDKAICREWGFLLSAETWLQGVEYVNPVTKKNYKHIEKPNLGNMLNYTYNNADIVEPDLLFPVPKGDLK
jgi:hypothetical protein